MPELAFLPPGNAPFIPCPALVTGCSWALTFSGFVSCRWRGEEWTGGSGSPLPSFLGVTTTVCPPGLEVLNPATKLSLSLLPLQVAPA